MQTIGFGEGEGTNQQEYLSFQKTRQLHSKLSTPEKYEKKEARLLHDKHAFLIECFNHSLL